MPSLNDLAIKYGTDKSSDDHNYCRIYERHLGPLREQKITLLELGVWEGASLKMWRDYLPSATIVGLDKADRRVQIPGVDVHICSQDNEDGLFSVALMYQGFDVIIDDASHISSKTIASFQLLYPHLKPGGLYVIEDLQTAYDVENYGENEARNNPNIPGGHTHTAMDWCKRLADEVNSSLFPPQHRLGYELAFVHFYPNICFIGKAR